MNLAAPAFRLWLLLLALLATLAGCGGGSSQAEPMQGTRDFKVISSNLNGSTYPLNIYLPPASAGARSSLPVVYALDGDTWFDVLVGIAEASHAGVIIVGIGNSALRARDYVPANSCTPGGGGQGVFFNFIRQELIPFVQAQIGGHPARRALLGHSHGGSFVFYALFAEAPGQHSFSAYLASDASLACMPDTVNGWDQAYAAAHDKLPVRLHVSSATGGNITANQAFVQTLQARHYLQLVLKAQAFSGTHTGIIPEAFADAIAFAFAAGP